MNTHDIRDTAGVVERDQLRDLSRDLELELGPLALKISASPRETCQALSVGTTRLYELLAASELVSYRDGRSRRILVSSIKAYIVKRLAESSNPAALKRATVTPRNDFPQLPVKG
jgi:excisionase family DNA binding protein